MTARSPNGASRPARSKLDLDTMHGSRKEAVKGLTQGIEFLFKKNKIEWLKGHASFESADTVKVGDRTVTRQEYRHRHRLVGDAAARASTIDQERIVDSTGALELAAGARSAWSSSAAA